MFDDCKGEKFLEMLAAFSTLVLRRVIANVEEGKGSIAGRLCVAEKIQREYQSLLPLSIAHRATLQGILKRKGELRTKYRELDHVLSVKERELDRRFEKVVETQTFLDQNIASEATVSRVAKQFDQHWQADRRFIDVIAQGEESTMTDDLLDTPTSQVWPSVNEGRFVADPTTSRHGLLEDLERRVDEQNERLQHWKDFKKQLQKNAQKTSPPKPGNMKSSPAKASRPYVNKEKDLVFSPRKSPRKSEFPIRIAHESPSQQQNAAVLSQKYEVDTSQVKVEIDNDDSGFSEITSQDVTTRLQAQGGSDGVPNAQKPAASSPPPKGLLTSPNAMAPPLNAPSHPPEEVHERLTRIPDEEDDLAEKIISQTLNAAPTPSKPPLSLVERTRQSMALASPGAKLSTRFILHQPTKIHPDAPEHPPPDPRTDLLERTRRSIPLVPSKSKASSRASIHNRRKSKIYPTNQFETPRKLGMLSELTPPDELFSPGAGYDSVFKSRPKIAMSPTGTPEPWLGDENGGSEDVGAGGLEDSPLARLTARI